MGEQTIIVDVDGSPASHTGLVWALARAQRTGARVRAIRCWMPVVLKAWKAAVTAEPVPSLAGQQARAERELAHVEATAVTTVTGITEVMTAAPLTAITDVIAVGARPVEYHPGPGITSEWDFISGEGHFDIPLRTLTSIDTENLLSAGRNIDGDRAAGSSLRVMGTAFATGHAAGI